MGGMLYSCSPSMSLWSRFSVTEERDRLSAENKVLREENQQLLAAIRVYRDVVIRLSDKQEAA